MKAKQVERCVDKLKQTEEKGTVSTALEGGAEELTVAIVGHSTTSSITMYVCCVFDVYGEAVIKIHLHNTATSFSRTPCALDACMCACVRACVCARCDFLSLWNKCLRSAVLQKRMYITTLHSTKLLIGHLFMLSNAL